MKINNLSGISDPYWYEWYVGLSFIVLMLNEDSNIRCVSFQSSEISGVDDVVVEYYNDEKQCIQVKHARNEKNFTISNLISSNQGKNKSLVSNIAKGWYDAYKNNKSCVPILYTNRSTNKSGYSNDDFENVWSEIKESINNSNDFNSLVVKDEYVEFWQKLLNELSWMDSKDDLYAFLRSFKILCNQESLEILENNILKRLALTFGLENREQSFELFKSLIVGLRIWTTSRRRKEYVTVEDVYNALSIPYTIDFQNHYLRPQSPFFESRLGTIKQLKESLIERKAPVIFLEGNPGSGKSNIVSYLANTENSIITLRYYIFKPITPEIREIPQDSDKLSDSRKLWSDLLDQLRLKFTNRLAEMKVPIRTDFLPVDKIKKNVLRLSYELYRETGQTTIIAIDGIDHAARASKREQIDGLLLKSLVHPQEVPEGVSFIISGQPDAGYPEYPIWLRENRSDVIRIQVPKIDSNDIVKMLKASNLNYSKDMENDLVRLISHVSQFDTLTAIFAINEAKYADDIRELEKKFKERKIHEGLSAYYNEIWMSAVKSIKNEVIHLDKKLSAYIMLSSELYNGSILEKMYKESGLTCADWENVLRNLAPLVYEKENNRFSLIHNDFRVHLMRILESESHFIKQTASLMADVYIKHKEFTTARHSELFRLLIIADRENEIVDHFTTEYVLEAWTLRRPYLELRTKERNVVNLIKQNPNWYNLESSIYGLLTFRQLDSTYQLAKDNDYFNTDSILPTILKTEAYVLNKDKRCIQDLFDVLDDLSLLINNNESERAIGLATRWLNCRPSDLLEYLPSYYYKSADREYRINETLADLLISWGSIFAKLKLNFDFDIYQLSSLDYEAYKYIVIGYFNELIKSKSSLRTIRYMKKFNNFLNFLDPIELMRLLRKMIDSDKWLELEYLLKNIKLEKFKSHEVIEMAFYSLLSSNKSLKNKYMEVYEHYEFDIIDYKDTQEVDNQCYCMLCFIKGWMGMEIEMCVEEAYSSYFSNRRDQRTEESAYIFFRVSSILGKMWSFAMNRSNTNSFDVAELLRLIFQLYEYEIVKITHFRNAIELRAKLLKLTYGIMEYIGDDAGNLFSGYFKLNYGVLLQTTFEFELLLLILSKNNEMHIARSILRYWIKDDGFIWKNAKNNISMIEEIVNVIEKYSLTEEAEMIKKYIGDNWIYFASSNQFFLTDTIKLFDQLLSRCPELWDSYGIRIYRICCSMQLDYIHKEKILILLAMSSARLGAYDFYRFIKQTNLVTHENISNGRIRPIFEGLIAALEVCEFERDELITFWCLTIGSLTWRSREDRIIIEDMKKAILKAASRYRYEGIENSIKGISPINFNISQNRGRNKQYRWIDKSNRRYVDKRISDSKTKIDKLKVNEYIQFILEIKKGDSVDYLTYLDVCHIVGKISREKIILSSDQLILLKNCVSDICINGYYDLDEIHSTLIKNAYSIFKHHNMDDDIIPIVMIENSFRNSSNNHTRKVIDILCTRLENRKIEDLIEHVNRLISMYELWMKEKYLNTNKIDIKSLDINSNFTWRDLVFEVLLVVISSYSSYQIEAGLQGLWHLAMLDEKIIYQLEEKWNDLEANCKEWLLIFLEMLLIERRDYYPLFEKILINCSKDYEHPEILMQSKIIISLFEDGEKFLFKKYLKVWLKKLRDKKDTNQYGILECFMGKPIAVRISALQHMTKDEMLDIQIELADRLEEDVSYACTKHLHSYNGDLHIDYNSDIRLLNKLIFSEIKDGRWNDISMNEFVKELCHTEDPFILIGLQRQVCDRNRWFDHYQLNPHILNFNEKYSWINEKTIKSRFRKHARAGLNPNEILLAAQLNFFALSCDYTYQYNHSINPESVDESRNESVVISRSYAIANKDANNVSNKLTTLFTKSLQIYNIPFQGIHLIPRIEILEKFKLVQSESNPIVFELNGKRVLWLESLMGPFRDERDDHYYKQHTLQRWICTVDFYNDLRKNFKQLSAFDELQGNIMNFNAKMLPDNMRMFI